MEIDSIVRALCVLRGPAIRAPPVIYAGYSSLSWDLWGPGLPVTPTHALSHPLPPHPPQQGPRGDCRGKRRSDYRDADAIRFIDLLRAH